MANNPRLSVLKRRSEFLGLQKNGHRFRASPWLLVNFAENPLGNMRCGWTLPRQIGTAVIRNRLKRWSRIFFRKLVDADQDFPVAINLVFRRAEDGFYKKLDYETFAKILEKSLQQIRTRVGKRRG